MTQGKLRLPRGEESVDVVYKAPRMICTSQHAIKQYAEKFAKRIQNRTFAVSAFSVFLTTFPLAVTEQKYLDIGWIPGESIPGIFIALSAISLIALAYFGIFSVLEFEKASSDYMIQELLADEDSSTTPTETSTSANVIPMKNFDKGDFR